MVDYLKTLVKDAIETVRSGYYSRFSEKLSITTRRRASLKMSILKCNRAPVIAEIKPESPSRGKLRRISSYAEAARLMEAGGAVGISVLTEPKHFGGSLEGLVEVKRATQLPVLMKDIVVDPVQIGAASRLGADAVLLIYSIFRRDMADYSLDELIRLAHSLSLEVLLETHTLEEFRLALETEADLVGINNRDLETLRVDLKTTERILAKANPGDRIIVSESGIERPEDIRFLSKCGAKAFLVGSAIMLADNIQEKVRELVNAI